MAMDWTWVERLLRPALEVAAQRTTGLEVAAQRTTGLVLLNTPLSPPRFRDLWQATGLHICVDGAVNGLRTYGPEFVPDLVIGDFDSADPDELAHFRALGVECRDLSHDQDTTDLEKALSAAREMGCRHIVAAGSFAGVHGRLDHTFGIANALYKFADVPIVMVGNDSFAILLGRGEHVLEVPNPEASPHCGLVPLGEPVADISTEGLVWNMTRARMAFGELVSVCNRTDPTAAGRVKVVTSHPVLWMCTIV